MKIDIVQAITDMKARKIKLYPCHSNRASEIGHPCERYLVYARTRWQERALHDVGLQFIFDQGNVEERVILTDLVEAGIQVIEQQRPFEWKEYQITGRIDAKILSNGTAIPVEIKSFNEWNWRSIDSVDDMLNSKRVYMRKYPAQMTCYLLMAEQEEGFFILKNKVNGLLKQIPIKLDYDYGESLIQKAERINRHIADGTLPEQVSWDIGACEYCAFQHICLPSHSHKATLLDDEELEGQLDRRAEIESIVKEYRELDKTIKAKVKEKPEIVIGDWLITGKWIDRKEHTVPAGKSWRTSIRRL